ncbi:MAG TPA: nuclear transport factor 2 family protein [Candidatus Tumulicola sp.]|jgi:ketosteroid isomerase-like protein
MHLRSIAAFFVITLAPAFASAAQTPPPAAILKLANAVVHAAKTNDASGLRGILTGDAVVVDENAPFVWRGSGAGAAWWSVVTAAAKKDRLTNMKAAGVRIGEYRESPTDAYLVQSMTITGLAGGNPFAESGTMTYTFHKSAGTWLISTMVWSTKS